MEQRKREYNYNIYNKKEVSICCFYYNKIISIYGIAVLTIINKFYSEIYLFH